MSTGYRSTDYAATGRLMRLLDEWRERALCKGRADLFYAPPDNTRAEKAALAVCDACPVAADCNRWVMGLSRALDPGGVCGGLTEAQRSQLRWRGRYKRCTGCGKAKSRSRFGQNTSSHDGLASRCVECAAAARRTEREASGLDQQGSP